MIESLVDYPEGPPEPTDLEEFGELINELLEVDTMDEALDVWDDLEEEKGEEISDQLLYWLLPNLVKQLSDG